MIGTSTFVSLGGMIAFGIIFPVALAIWWSKTRKEKVSTILIGAATWFVFAIILESIPKAIFFNPALPIGKTVMGSVVLYTVIGALLAGVFEESGRFIVFKTLLRKRTNKETAISQGIGHGGFEALFLLVLTGVQYMIYAAMINAGTFQDLIAQVEATGADVSALQALPEQVMAWTSATSLLWMIERISAVLLHIGLSIMVFYAVKKAKLWLYFLAMALHAVIDIPAALYQCGVITNLYVVEAMLAAYAIVFFVLVYKVLYANDDVTDSDRGETK